MTGHRAIGITWTRCVWEAFPVVVNAKGPALRAGVGHGTAHPSRDVGDVDEDRLAAVAGRRLGPGVRMGEDGRESSEAEFCVV